MSFAEGQWLYSLISSVVIPVVVLAFALSVLRLLRGPDLLNRILALDLIGMFGIGIAVSYAIVTGQSALLDVAMVLALLAFVSTLALAAYVERRNRQWL